MLRRGNLLVRGASGARRYFYFTNVLSTAMHYGKDIQVFRVNQDVPCLYVQYDSRPSLTVEDDNAYYTQMRQRYGLDETIPVVNVRRGNGMADELQVFGMPQWLTLVVTVDSKGATLNNVVDEIMIHVPDFREEWRWDVDDGEADDDEDDDDDGCIIT